MSDNLKHEAKCKDCHKLIPADEHRRYGGYCSDCAQKQDVRER